MYPYSFIVKALQKTKELIENKDEKIVIDTLDAAANAKVCTRFLRQTCSCLYPYFIV